MREMKDSGVDWIDTIPEDWSVVPLKTEVSFGKGLPITKENLIEKGVAVVSYGQIHSKMNTGSHLKEELVRYVSEDYLQTNPECLAQKGDIFVADTSEDYDGIGNAVLIDWDGDVFAGYHTVIIRPQNKQYSKYLSYLFMTDAWRSQLRSRASGIKVYSVTQGLLKKTEIIIPNSVYVQRLTGYLDRKCSTIDNIISKQEQIIEKLKEYKLSLITEAVTKGLDPNVEMIDSGTEWLGKYPKHWQYLSFKNVLVERVEKNDPVLTEERLSLSIDKGVTLYADKTTNLDRFKDDVSLYKLAHKGDLVLNSMNMIVGAIGISEWFGCVSPAYYTYYDTKEDHSTAKYCDYLLRCKTMRKVLLSLGKGIMAIDRGDDRINTCRLKVSRNDLRALKIPVPPDEEQRKIIDYLNKKEIVINKTIADRERAIERLQEYKKSLIYEVVTGKKEV